MYYLLCPEEQDMFLYAKCINASYNFSILITIELIFLFFFQIDIKCLAADTLSYK